MCTLSKTYVFKTIVILYTCYSDKVSSNMLLSSVCCKKWGLSINFITFITINCRLLCWYQSGKLKNYKWTVSILNSKVLQQSLFYRVYLFIMIWCVKNSPDLRTFDLLAEKQTEAAHIERSSKCKRLLSFQVGSMISWRSKVEPAQMFIVRDSVLLFVFIQTPSKRRRRLSQRRRQLRFDTEKITACKRSAGWTDGQTST